MRVPALHTRHSIPCRQPVPLLLHPRLPVQVDGVSIIKDKEVTGFTNAEEGVMNKYEAVSQPSGPGSCEDAMTAAGGAHTFPQIRDARGPCDCPTEQTMRLL